MVDTDGISYHRVISQVKNLAFRGACWLSQVEHDTPELGVVSSSPTVGIELTLKKEKKKEKKILASDRAKTQGPFVVM